MIAVIADLGHRLGTRVWIGRRQQVRRVDRRPLADRLDMEERDIVPTVIAWGRRPSSSAWTAPGISATKATFLFEVEWTAMLGDPVLVRHSRFPSDDKVVRFLVVPPERAELGAIQTRSFAAASAARSRAQLARSQVGPAGRLRGAHGRVADGLEPYLGLDADAAAGEPAAVVRSLNGWPGSTASRVTGGSRPELR